MKIHGPEQEGRNTAKVNDAGQLLVSSVPEEITNESVVLGTDYRLSVALGLIPGVTSVTLVGRSASFGTADVPVSVWPDVSTYPWQSSSYSLEIVSTDAADTSAGTGIRAVAVIGLDDSWLDQTEVVLTNGVTPVAVPGTWRRVNSLVGVGAGSGLTNAGQIVARLSGGGALQSIMPVGKAVSNQSVYTMAANRKGLLSIIFSDILRTAGGTADAELGIFVRENSVADQPFLQVFDEGLTTNGTSSIAKPVRDPAFINSMMDIDYRCVFNSSNGTVVGTAVSILLYDNDIL